MNFPLSSRQLSAVSRQPKRNIDSSSGGKSCLLLSSASELDGVAETSQPLGHTLAVIALNFDGTVFHGPAGTAKPS
jgi:hypothetical protein